MPICITLKCFFCVSQCSQCYSTRHKIDKSCALKWTELPLTECKMRLLIERNPFPANTKSLFGFYRPHQCCMSLPVDCERGSTEWRAEESVICVRKYPRVTTSLSWSWRTDHTTSEMLTYRLADIKHRLTSSPAGRGLIATAPHIVFVYKGFLGLLLNASLYCISHDSSPQVIATFRLCVSPLLLTRCLACLLSCYVIRSVSEVTAVQGWDIRGEASDECWKTRSLPSFSKGTSSSARASCWAPPWAEESSRPASLSAGSQLLRRLSSSLLSVFLTFFFLLKQP